MIINTKTDNAKLLVNALKANGLFSMVSGHVLLLLQDTLALWFGQIEPVYVAGLGVGLILFSMRLFYLAGPGQLLKAEARMIIGSDIGWVIGSITLLAVFYANITQLGIVFALVVSLVVGSFAYAQAKGLARV